MAKMCEHCGWNGCCGVFIDPVHLTTTNKIRPTCGIECVMDDGVVVVGHDVVAWVGI